MICIYCGEEFVPHPSTPEDIVVPEKVKVQEGLSSEGVCDSSECIEKYDNEKLGIESTGFEESYD